MNSVPLEELLLHAGRNERVGLFSYNAKLMSNQDKLYYRQIPLIENQREILNDYVSLHLDTRGLLEDNASPYNQTIGQDLADLEKVCSACITYLIKNTQSRLPP